MAIDKRVNYDMQGHKKPARNYLGKQKTVKDVPIKWKSGPKAPETELAYITKKEKDLLLKKDLHGSLKHGPNTGPDGIMSLDSQGDYTRDRSPAGRTGGSPAQQERNEADRRAMMTGQVDRGQTAAVSDRVRRGAVPEWVTTPSGKRKYVGSAYKSTGQQGFLSKLFGGRGYRGTVGTGSGRFFDRKSTIKFNPVTGQYESEEENVGDIKPGWGGKILGGALSMFGGLPGKALSGIMAAKNWAAKTGQNIGEGARTFGQYPTLDRWLNRDTGKYDDQDTAIDVPFDPNERIQDTSFSPTIPDPNILPVAEPNINNRAYQSSRAAGNYDLVSPNNAWSMNQNIGRINADDFNNQVMFQDGGRAGYRDGEFVDEDINIQGPGFDVNENVEMAEADPFQMRIQELMSKGLSWEDAYDIAAQEFQDEFAEGPEESFSEDQGIASLV